MSNRIALFLGLRIKIRTEEHRFSLPFPPMAIYVLTNAIRSFEWMIGLLTGNARRYARPVFYSILTALYVFMLDGPTEFVNVDVHDKDGSEVKVKIRTY